MKAITLTGILDQGYTIVHNKKAAFGFLVKYKGKLYEPNMTLHAVKLQPEEEGEEIYMPIQAVHHDQGSGGFDDIQALVIES